MGLFLIIVITTAAFRVGEGGLVHFTLIKKKIKMFLIYKEIQMGTQKSYVKKGFLIYEEMR
jgi:hypothetical protein